MEGSWSETQSTPPKPTEPAGILKPRPGLFEPPRPRSNKTIRFRTESQHIESSQTEDASVSNPELPEPSDSSGSSSPSSSSNSEDTGGQTQRSAAQQPPHGGNGAVSSSAADRMLALPSWFTEHVKRFMAAFTARAEPAGHGRVRSTSSSDRVQTGRDGDFGGRRPGHRRRRRGGAFERYLPPSQDDMRWRVALSRYALLTLLGVLTLLFAATAALRVMGGDGRSGSIEEESAAVTPEAGEDDERPGRHALKTSARGGSVRPDRELTVGEAYSDTFMATTDETSTTSEPPTSDGAEPASDGPRASRGPESQMTA